MAADWRTTEVRSPYELQPVRPRLWRSRDDKVIAGVCGGLAEKFEIRPGLARVLYVAISIFGAGFPGVFVYLVLWAITKPHGPEDFR